MPLLEGAIDIIVDKAQMEQHFGSMYADLCLKIALTPIAELGDEGKGTQFKKSLLQRCQAEFERDQKHVLEELSVLPEGEREEKIGLSRKRYVGHMKFVGQLFRVNLLSDKIMHCCVQDLFAKPEEGKGAWEPDEEKIRCLCTLLGTIGHQLEAGAMKKPEHGKFMKK